MLPAQLTEDPTTMSEQERSKMGAVRLPDSLEKAFASFEEDTCECLTCARCLAYCQQECMLHAQKVQHPAEQLFCVHTAMREALNMDLGDKLVASFLAGHKSELEWAASKKESGGSTDDHIARIAAELYDRY